MHRGARHGLLRPSYRRCPPLSTPCTTLLLFRSASAPQVPGPGRALETRPTHAAGSAASPSSFLVRRCCIAHIAASAAAASTAAVAAAVGRYPCPAHCRAPVAAAGRPLGQAAMSEVTLKVAMACEVRRQRGGTQRRPACPTAPVAPPAGTQTVQRRPPLSFPALSCIVPNPAGLRGRCQARGGEAARRDGGGHRLGGAESTFCRGPRAAAVTPERAA